MDKILLDKRIPKLFEVFESQTRATTRMKRTTVVYEGNQITWYQIVNYVEITRKRTTQKRSDIFKLSNEYLVNEYLTQI